MNILLVDDEVELASTLAERLSMRGMTADWVSSGEAALELIKTKSYDVAVLDLKMPGINGIELMKRLGEMVPTLKFVIMTGHGSLSDYASHRVPTVRYLAKPLRLSELITFINELMAAS